MNNDVVCNICKKEFPLTPGLFSTLYEGDLHVDYFSCPFCGEKYLAFVSDSEMRELVQKRKHIADKIKAGHAKRFTKMTLDGYMRDMEKVKARQVEIYPSLKERGKALLDKRYGKEKEKAD